MLIPIAEDDSSPDKSDTGDNRLHNTHWISSQGIMSKNRIDLPNQEFSHSHEQHRCQANQHVGPNPRPLSRSFTFPAYQSSEADRDEALTQNHKLRLEPIHLHNLDGINRNATCEHSLAALNLPHAKLVAG